MIDAPVRVEGIGRTSFRFPIAMLRGEDVLSGLQTTYVCAKPGETCTSLPVPDAFIATLSAFERLSPERALSLLRRRFRRLG